MSSRVTEDAASPPTRERFMAIVRRKLGERGYTGAALEAKLQEIMSKQQLSFDIDWSKVSEPG